MKKEKTIPAPILILRNFTGSNADIIWQINDEKELTKTIKENEMGLNDWIIYPAKIMHMRMGTECLHSGWVKNRTESKRQKNRVGVKKR